MLRKRIGVPAVLLVFVSTLTFLRAPGSSRLGGLQSEPLPEALLRESRTAAAELEIGGDLAGLRRGTPLLALDLNGEAPSGRPKDASGHLFDMGPFLQGANG